MPDPPKRPFWAVESSRTIASARTSTATVIPKAPETSEMRTRSQSKSDGSSVVEEANKRRRVELVFGRSHISTPTRSQTLPPRPQSVPPIINSSTITPNRMITRSLSRSGTPLVFDRAQTPSITGTVVTSPSESIISNTLRQVSSTSSTILNSPQHHPLPDRSHIVSGPDLDTSGRVFSHPGYPPFTPLRSVSQAQAQQPYTQAAQNGIGPHGATRESDQAQARAHAHAQTQAQAQTILNLRDQLQHSHNSLRSLESRLINTESLLYFESTELDHARMEIQSLRFQLSQRDNVAPPQTIDPPSLPNGHAHGQLESQKREYEAKLSAFSQQLENIRANVKADREKGEKVQTELKERNQELQATLKQSEKTITEIGCKLKVIEARERKLQGTLVEKDQLVLRLENQVEHLKQEQDTSKHQLTTGIASREALSRVNEAQQKVIANLKNELQVEKNRCEETRKTGWEQLNTLRRDHDALLSRTRAIENENRELQYEIGVLKESEKERSNQLIREKREIEREKAELSKETKTRSVLREKVEQLEESLWKAIESHRVAVEGRERSNREVKQKDRQIEELNEQLKHSSSSSAPSRKEEAECKDLKNRLIEHKMSCEELKQEVTKAQTEKTSLAHQVKQLIKANRARAESLRKAQAQGKALTKAEEGRMVDTLQKETMNQKNQIKQLKSRVEELMQFRGGTERGEFCIEHIQQLKSLGAKLEKLTKLNEGLKEKAKTDDNEVKNSLPSSSTNDNLLDQISILESEKERLKLDKNLLAVALRDLQQKFVDGNGQQDAVPSEASRRLQKRLNDYKRFAKRIRTAHTKYKRKYGAGVTKDIFESCTSQAQKQSQHPGKRKRDRMTMNTMSIRRRLEWADYWFRLIDFALKDLDR
ncbi:uncharacterized protein I303_100286 [Kwoniella dejecticola CBS 10117]|uniref:Uncharacterized protein n=1 Tax=Kwoniella dejecticola CBS 10117 TaxID=1296121 RepID=A0A1A6AEJ6_9TREE|nr:uncharacterized protein I303_00286 [Kwoniella dejecticola CBS 10117]OBR88469.1 hypothetical protein I303_00286 [Kwoniella dejecticola CBS 10117]